MKAFWYSNCSAICSEIKDKLIHVDIRSLTPTTLLLLFEQPLLYIKLMMILSQEPQQTRAIIFPACFDHIKTSRSRLEEKYPVQTLILSKHI